MVPPPTVQAHTAVHLGASPPVWKCRSAVGSALKLRRMKFVLLALCCCVMSPALACGFIPNDLRQSAARSAQTYGINETFFLAMIWVESAFCPQAISAAGALGLGQLMPRTAAALGVDARDPNQNLDGAARYLKAKFDEFHDWSLALAAYNAGSGAVRKYGGVPPYPETQAHIRKVMAAYARLAGRDRPPVPAAAATPPPRPAVAAPTPQPPPAPPPAQEAGAQQPTQAPAGMLLYDATAAATPMPADANQGGMVMFRR